MKTVDPLESVNVAKRDSVQTAEQAMHTPGRWQAISSLVTDMRDADGNGQFVIADCGALTCFRREEECIANAERIAHCVNTHDHLLAALCDALHYIENHPRSDHRNDPVAKAISDGYAEGVRIAIAKAEGRDEP